MILGMCGIVKLLISSSIGTIPANIHCDKLNPKIDALKSNRIKVVTENTPWPGDIIAGVTSMGFGGVNTFALLSFEDSRDDGWESSFPPQIPLLVTFSGRTTQTLRDSLNEIGDLSDKRVVTLLHAITAGQSVKGYPSRGYILMNSDMRIVNVEEKPGPSKPPTVVFIFSGRGSQINGMLDTFKEFPVYRESIERSEKYLLDCGYHLRTEASDEMHGGTIALSVGTTCVQIAIIALLSSVGISPHLFVGHSTGELLCDYADGHLSHEQTVHLALLRALTIENAKEMDGEMQADEKFRFELNKIPGHNETPSERWIRTRPGSSPSDASDRRTTTRVADVIANMTTSRVDFEEKVKLIPDGSLVLEIAPEECNLESVIRESILSLNPNSTTKILDLTTRQDQHRSDHYSVFLAALGELYKAGLNPDLRQIYQVELPLGPWTSYLSHMVKWDHRTSWKVPTIQRVRVFSGQRMRINYLPVLKHM